MSAFLAALPDGFLERLLAGVGLNFWIATVALALGLAAGLPLALCLASTARGLRWAAAPVIALMRAAPTFVVMYFLFQVLNAGTGTGPTLSPLMMVAWALMPYAAAYIADSGADALRHWRAGSRSAALLFLPNLLRAYFVMVMSSGIAAAIGVQEGISIILRQANEMASFPQQLGVYALGILVFGLILQTGLLAVTALRRYASGRILDKAAWRAGPSPRNGSE
jgi:His/Glu/Gln/Arg/opine family amino acid ABC transporter permease subunit